MAVEGPGTVHTVCADVSFQDLEEDCSYTVCHQSGELGEGCMGPVFTESCTFLTISK